MKKAAGLFLAVVLALSITGCSLENPPVTTPKPTPAPTSEPVAVIDDDVIKEKAPVLTVSGGDIQGYYSDDKTVRVYKGIPFAEAERFKAPVETSWEGVLDCTDWGPSCIQPEERPMGPYTAEFMGSCDRYSEDCLHLNVWTANDDETGKPVIVYFHGGAYTAGNASCKVYEGKGMAQKGVVYVSANYRLGLFGFYANEELVKEDPVAAGNYAVLDWIAAMKWVQENIEVFGGDPNNVTIMGQSAGAGAVNVLTSSPMAKGLFHHAFSMSHNNVVCTEFAFGTQAEKVAGFEEAIEKNGLPSLSLEEMRAMSGEEFFETYAKIWYVNSSPCQPCIDGVLLPDTCANMLSSGRANPVDLMVGTTSSDLGGKVTGLTGELQVDAWTGETALFAYAHAMGGYGKNVYTYIFTHAMPGKSTKDGAFHTSDVPYFLNVFSKQRQDYWTDEDYALGDVMSDYLVNFARTGDPNGEGLVEWAPNKGTPGAVDYSYMELDTTCVQKQTPASSVTLVEQEYQGQIQQMERNRPADGAE